MTRTERTFSWRVLVSGVVLMRLCSLILGAAISVLSLSAAQAADSDFMADPIYDSPMFNFDGIYVGVQAGGVWEWTPAPGVLAGDIGGMAGANFSINNALIAGVEFQADAYIDMTGVRGWDALFLGHFGGFVTDSAIIYAAAGAGTTDTDDGLCPWGRRRGGGCRPDQRPRGGPRPRSLGRDAHEREGDARPRLARQLAAPHRLATSIALLREHHC